MVNALSNLSKALITSLADLLPSSALTCILKRLQQDNAVSLAEKKKAIADQTALEKTIAENESRLAWLNEFKADLEKVLAV